MQQMPNFYKPYQRAQHFALQQKAQNRQQLADKE